MANPRMIFTISEEAREALKRVSDKTMIQEADLMRLAIGKLLEEYGEQVSVEVDRGGYRGGPKSSREKESSTHE